MHSRAKYAIAGLFGLLTLAPSTPGTAWSVDTDLGSSPATFLGEAAEDGLMAVAQSFGDINGDSRLDVLLSAPYSDLNAADAGAVYVQLGPIGWAPDQSMASADCLLYGDQTGERAGFSLASGGDVDGDGADDLLVGAPGSSCSGAESGTVYLVFGEPAGWGSSFALSASDASYCGVSSDDQAGYAVAIVGDTDGDGLDDFAIGVPFSDDAAYNAGQVHLFHGDEAGTFFPPAVSAPHLPSTPNRLHLPDMRRSRVVPVHERHLSPLARQPRSPRSDERAFVFGGWGTNVRSSFRSLASWATSLPR